MALRFDNATKYITLSGVNTPYTITGWLSQVTVAPGGTWNTFLNLRNTIGGFCNYQIDPSQILSFWDGVTDRTLGSAISVGEWVFWAVSASSTTALTLYTSRLNSDTLTSLAFTSANAINTIITIGAYSYGFSPEKADADISTVKLFNSVLSAAQILQEKNMVAPFFNTASWLPMWDYTNSTTQATDQSGNGANWTVNGTISVIQSHPPILQRIPSLLIPQKITAPPPPTYYASPSMLLAC